MPSRAGCTRTAFPGPRVLPPALSPSEAASVGNPGSRAESESIYSGENIFVLRVKGGPFQQLTALFAAPVLGPLREACSSRQSAHNEASHGRSAVLPKPERLCVH